MTEHDRPVRLRPAQPRPLQRALTLSSKLADKGNDAFLEVAYGLGRSAAWTTSRVGRVSKLFARKKPEPAAPPRPALTLEERLRDLLLEERERLLGGAPGSPSAPGAALFPGAVSSPSTASPEELAKLAKRLSELIGRIFSGDASAEDPVLVNALRGLIARSKPFADFMAVQAASAPEDKQKSSMLRRIFEDNLRLRDAAHE
jgi:hypothetical protein